MDQIEGAFASYSGQLPCLLRSRASRSPQTSTVRYFAFTVRVRRTTNNALRFPGAARMVCHDATDHLRTGTDVVLECTIISAALEKSLSELICPLNHNGRFGKTREVIYAILHAKSRGVPEINLKENLVLFSHTAEYACLPALSNRQRQVVQAVVQKVYETDNFFGLVEVGCRAVLWQVPPQDVYRYIELEELVRKGDDISTTEMQNYLVERMRKEDEQNQIGLEVATRRGLPDRWRNIVVMLTIVLRQDFANRKS